MSKKAFSIVTKTIIGLALLLSPFLSLNAISPFIQESWFTINNNSASSLYLAPWDNISLNFSWENAYSENLTSLWFKLSFWNNSWFSYSWDLLSFLIATSSTVWPWEYSTSNGIDFLIYEPLAIWWTTSLSANSNSFVINSDISTFENNLNLSFYWNRDSDWSLISWDDFSKTIFVDVKPHIIDKYLEKNWSKTTSIQWNWKESFDLIVEVEDLNSCNNVDWWTVTADLTSLWLTNNEVLTFDSCISSNIAKFKKSDLTTSETLWNKSILYSNFSVIDEEWNTHNPDDLNFARASEKNSLDYEVTNPGTPNIFNFWAPQWVTLSKVLWKNVDIVFNSDQNSSVKATLQWCGETDINNIFYNDANFLANSWVTATIDSSKLSPWENTIFLCSDNWIWGIWEFSFIFIEDSIPAEISSFNTPVWVIEEDADIDFSCSEDWNYYVDITNTSWTTRAIEKTTITASTVTNALLPNSNMIFWDNTVSLYCEDSIWNPISQDKNIFKYQPSPSMETANLTVADNDIDYEWLSWRDFSVSWDTTIWESFTEFERYNIYLLPKWVILGAWVQSYVWDSEDPSVWSLDLNPLLVEDSLWNPLASGVDYIVYIVVVWTSGQLWTPWTFEITPVSDNIIKPVPLSAKFTSNTTLEITTDTTLNTDLSSFDASKVVYKVNWAFYSPTSVISVDWAKINYTIPSLEDPSAVWTELDIGAFWLRSSVWGFNDDFTWKLNITDWQKPLFSNFNTGDSAIYGIYFSENMSLSWSHNENIKSWTMKIIFKSIFWAPSSDKITILTDSYLSSWNHNITLNLNDINEALSPKLICWANYNIILEWEDSTGNKAVSTSIDNINMDNCAPEKTIINNLDIEWSSDINFTWQVTNDDSIFSSWVWKYTLELFSWNSCVTALETINDIATNSLDKNLVDWDYSWKVKAIDNTWNSWEYSDCDDFRLDSTVPSFSNISLNDTTDSSDSYTDNWNILELKANITNTDINNVYADLSELIWDASYNNVSCLAPLAWVTCTFVWDLVTYTFNTWGINALNAGLKNSKLTAYNINWINKVEETQQITADVSAPSVLSDALIYPNWWEVIWGDDLRILWDKTKVTDDIWIEKIEITIIDWWVEWFVICSWENTWFCDLNLYEPLIEDIKVRLTAIDFSWKESFDESDSVFTIDRKAPEVWADTVTFPNWEGIIFAWGEETTITWDPSKVTDDTSLDPNPVIIYISEDDTGYYRILEENLPNTWSHTLTLPDTFAPEATIRIWFKDIVWNIWSDDSDNIFKIDNRKPTLEITYAGTWWTTPHSWRSLNQTGMDLSLISSDDNLDRVYVEFKNTTNNTFWDNTNLVYSAGLVENNICIDWLILWNDGSCNSVNLSFSPEINDAHNYEMIVYALDEAWNIKTSTVNSYIWDRQPPTLTINTLPEFFSNNTEVSWTSSDLSWISAVNIKIKKWEEYWNWSEFTPSEISLVTKTSDNYANWRYDINPIEEEDWTIYTFEVTALDKAYKDNNSASASISIKSDNSWPVISDWFSILPSEWTVLSWGETIDITWDNSKVIDAFSWVDNNTLEMSYFNWNSYENIASDIDLSLWTFSWSVPYVDTEISRIKFRIKDNLWNYWFNFDGNDFSIDSTNPSVSSLETLENGISNWSINALRFKLSESILDSTIAPWDFSINSWAIAVTWISTWAVANDDEIIIEFSELSWTWQTPTLSYSWNSIEDLAWRKLWNFSNISSVDKVTPRLLSLKAFDDNENWKTDKIELTFSETLSSLSSLQWIYISGLLSWYDDTWAYSSEDKIIINISEWFEYKTDTELLLVSISWWDYEDLSWNNIESFWLTWVEDRIKPIFVWANSIDSNNNNKVDKIRIEFSEEMKNPQVIDFSISNFSDWMSIIWASIENNEVILDLVETTLDNDTDNNILVSYTPWILSDMSENQANAVWSVLSNDTLPPIIEKIETRDLDKNWFIDWIYIETSENLNDDFSLINYTVNGYNINSIDSWEANNDNNFIINIDEIKFNDTDATPLVKLNSNSSLWDEHWNYILSDTWAWENAIDKVWPVIILARYEENSAWVSDDKIYITFSEDILPSSIDTNVWWFLTDFITINDGWVWNTGVSVITETNQIEVTLWWNSLPLTPWVSEIYIKDNALSDSIWNLSANGINSKITLSSSLIINEVMFSSDTQNQYIEIRNLSSSWTDLLWFHINNIWWNWVDYAFTSWTIPAFWHYLIARTTKENSILNVDPDLIIPFLSLDPTSQNDIELKVWTTIIDSAKASPYPAWDNTGIAMERKEVVSDWRLDSSWHASQVSSGFDSNNYKWTPWEENIFDWVAPIISSYSPNNLDLLQIAPDVVFNYNDDYTWINTDSANFNIKKWEYWKFWNDLSWTILNNSVILDNKAIYSIEKWISAWRYRIEFEISDKAWNKVSQDIDFFVDNFSFSIENNTLNIWEILPWSNNTSDWELIIKIKTLWAWFNISQDKINQLSSWINNITNYDGDVWFGYKIQKIRNWAIIPYWDISAISWEIENKTIESTPYNDLKEYVYKIKYFVKVETIQESWKYSSDINFKVVPIY